MDLLAYLLPKLEHFRLLGYWLVGLVALVDSLAFVGLAVPGTLFAVLVGFLAARGFFDLGDLFWFLIIGAFLGDAVSFYLGQKGKNFFQPTNRIFKSSYLAKGEAFFQAHGKKSIFLSKFVSPMRSVIPFVAGLAKMKTRRFLILDFITVIIWTTSFVLLGYFFGQAWQLIQLWTTRITVFVLILIVFLIAFYLLKWLILKKGRQFFVLMKSIMLSIKQAIINNQEVKRITIKHQRLFAFVGNRLKRDKLSGLPLTFLLVAFFYVLSLFVGIIDNVITDSSIIAVDVRVANLLTVFHNPQLIKIFFWLTLLGKWEIVVSLALAFSIILWLWRKKSYLLPLWLAITGSELFDLIGKLAIHRARPEAAVYLESSYSFPSGHAAIAVAFYGFAGYCLWQQVKNWKNRVNILFFSLLTIALIGFSRLYLGVHFLSDVWAGYLLGALWLIIAISLQCYLAHWQARRQTTKLLAVKSWVKIATPILLIAELAFFIAFAQRYNPPLKTDIILPPTIVAGNILDYFQSNQLPKYSETLTAQPQEPISFVITAPNDQQFIKAFQTAGWQLADKVSPASILALAKTALFNQKYAQAPMTPSFWNSQIHDFGFEEPTTSQTVRSRHHARFWRTSFKTKDGQNIYVGVASLDIGLKWWVTHKINPDIDTEREFLFNDLKQQNLIADWQKEKMVDPILGTNFSGDPFFTDGQAYLIKLKKD